MRTTSCIEDDDAGTPIAHASHIRRVHVKFTGELDSEDGLARMQVILLHLQSVTAQHWIINTRCSLGRIRAGKEWDPLTHVFARFGYPLCERFKLYLAVDVDALPDATVFVSTLCRAPMRLLMYDTQGGTARLDRLDPRGNRHRATRLFDALLADEI